MRWANLSRKPRDRFVSFEHFVSHNLRFFLIFAKVYWKEFMCNILSKNIEFSFHPWNQKKGLKKKDPACQFGLFGNCQHQCGPTGTSSSASTRKTWILSWGTILRRGNMGTKTFSPPAAWIQGTPHTTYYLHISFEKRSCNVFITRILLISFHYELKTFAFFKFFVTVFMISE